MTRPWQDLLASARKALAGATEVLVATSHVRPMRGQPRVHFSADSLDRLGESMASIGQIYPGIVRSVPADGLVQYELLDGERRWRAAKQRGLKYRALLVSVDDAAASFLIAAVANFNREAHTATEVSDAIDAMLRIGMPMPEIASVLGLSEFWAGQMHSLQKLIPEVRAMLDPTLPKDKSLPVTGAMHISKVAPELQLDLARRVLAKTLSLRELRAEAIRRSRKAGRPIRERVVEPRFRWKSLTLRSRQVAQIARDLETMLGKGDELRAVIALRPPAQLTAIGEHLRATAESANRVAAHIEIALERAGVAT